MLAIKILTVLATLSPPLVGAIPYTALGTTTSATTTLTTPALELRRLYERDSDFATSPEIAGQPTSTPTATQDHLEVVVAAAAAAATAAPSAPPAEDPQAEAELAAQGYAQVTYYSCVAYAESTHCGWHEEVVHSGAGGLGTRQAVLLGAWCVVGGVLVNAIGW